MYLEQSLVAKVVIFGSLAILVVSLAFSRIRVTTATFSIAVFAAAAFLASALWNDSMSGGLKLAPTLGAIWLWLFLIYFVGVRYISGHGIVQRVAYKDLLPTRTSVSPRWFHLALRGLRHILLWPVVVLVAVIIVRGLSGYGWVTRL